MRKNLLCLLISCLLVVVSGAQTRAREKSLIIWSHWDKEPVKINFLSAVAEAFEQAEGIPVDIVWTDKTELVEKLPFSMENGEPDIAYVDLGFGHPRIARNLADLSDVTSSGQTYSSWGIAGLGEEANIFLPLEGVSNAIYYNKDLFTQAGIQLPSERPMTGDEFMAAVKTLKEQGITPIAEGGADRVSKLAIPLLNIIFRYIGPDKMAQLRAGEIDFSDPDVLAALNYWTELIDVGYDTEKAMTLSMMDGIFEMTDGNAAINFCGTWIYSKFGTTEHDNGQVGVMDWFTVEGGKGNQYYEIVWVAGYGVNKNSQQLDTAKKFMEFLLTPQAASLWATHVQSPYPVMTDDFPENSLYGALAQQRDNLTPINDLYSYPNFQAKAANNMWNELIPQFISGTLSVEEFVERMNSRL